MPLLRSHPSCGLAADAHAEILIGVIEHVLIKDNICVEIFMQMGYRMRAMRETKGSWFNLAARGNQ